MTNPRLEDGYTRIANEILVALSFMNLSPYESRVLSCVIRQTYGWHKKTDWISLSQFSEKTGLDRRLAYRAITGLLKKGMVVIYRDDKKRPRYGFQKNYERWKLSPKQRTALNKEMTREREKKEKSISRDDKVSSLLIPTKDTLTKETVKSKEERDSVSSSLVLSSSFKDENPETKGTNKQDQIIDTRPTGEPLAFKVKKMVVCRNCITPQEEAYPIPNDEMAEKCYACSRCGRIINI